MLKSVNLVIDKPICDCEEPELSWVPYFINNNMDWGINVVCKQCQKSQSLLKNLFETSIVEEKTNIQGKSEPVRELVHHVKEFTSYDDQFLRSMKIVPPSQETAPPSKESK